MKSFILICDVCGTVNQMSQTHCLACGQVLAAAGQERGLTAAPTASSLAQHLLKDRYRVLHVIGKGGMGIVYIGVDTRLGNRLVAIKEMGQNGLSQTERSAAARNFEREAHLLAGLQHPNLPSIYDHFEEGQRWYLVMSFIKGQTLVKYLEAKGGRLPLEDALEIGIALCNVLEYLHSCNPPIIFRDLKPSNIMRTVDGHIYLIDFGIARIFKLGKVTDTAYQGSSGYAAPEQYGLAQTTPRSDIYSLGATLYYLLSGYEVAYTPFQLPPLQSLLPTTPIALTNLITSMLAMDEKARPESAATVKIELQKIAAGVAGDAPYPVLSAQPPLAFISQASSVSLSPQLPPFSPPLAPLSPQVPPLSPYLTPLPTSPRKTLWRSKHWLWACVALLVLVLGGLGVYLAIQNSNANNTTTPLGVVTLFCRALNSHAPDFQTAYNQLSSSYQRLHSLIDFQEFLLGTTQCTVASVPNDKNQAEVSLTLNCPPPPPRPDSPPPLHGPPPPRINPLDLTLLKEGANDWKIDSLYMVGRNCSLPPGDGGPPPPQ